MSRDLVTRCLLATAVFVLIFALRWDFSSPPPDFQAWSAADALSRFGANPYDADVLNAELSSDRSYGPTWQGDDAELFRMHFFNPPTWLVVLRALGTSAAAMSMVGAMLVAGSMVALDRNRPFATFAAHLAGAAIIVLSDIGTSTLQFGQTGLFLAGLVGLRLALVQAGDPSARGAGVPVALLSFKPHIAVAALLPQLITTPARALRDAALPSALLLVATVILIGPRSFGHWIEATLRSEAIPPFDDMTLRTLIPGWPLPETLNIPLLVVAFVVVAFTTRRWSAANSGLLMLWSIAITIVLSGHGFEHDWLWLVFVPIVCNWGAKATLGVAALVSLLHGVGFTTSPDHIATLSTTSMVALAATAYLAWSCYNASRLSEVESDLVPQRATAIA